MRDDSYLPKLEITDEILEKWQNIVNILSEILDIPAALIMRIVESDIEVFITSHGGKNPYKKGDHEKLLGSGLYCETVIRSGEKLLVPNALKDSNWKNNPDVKINMISYLGFPILLPDGKPFGTICILDNIENSYSPTVEKLLSSFRDIVQSELSLIYMNRVLGEKNRDLSDYITEIKTLRGIIPICASCKKIRDDRGYWTQVEKYIEEHSDVHFSHGLCSECLEKLYRDQEDME